LRFEARRSWGGGAEDEGEEEGEAALGHRDSW
jgi:hypothetical protein